MCMNCVWVILFYTILYGNWMPRDVIYRCYDAPLLLKIRNSQLILIYFSFYGFLRFLMYIYDIVLGFLRKTNVEVKTVIKKSKEGTIASEDVLIMFHNPSSCLFTCYRKQLDRNRCLKCIKTNERRYVCQVVSLKERRKVNYRVSVPDC